MNGIYRKIFDLLRYDEQVDLMANWEELLGVGQQRAYCKVRDLEAGLHGLVVNQEVLQLQGHLSINQQCE